MKLVRQVTLIQAQYSGDKVFELDLCEVGGDRFVVNFRYGRVGGTLKDGSKTVIAVSREEAERVFARELDAQRAKGYREAGATSAEVPAAGGTRAVGDRRKLPESQASGKLDDRSAAVVRRLEEGVHSRNPWSLTRAVWRAGELGISAAEPPLLDLLPFGQPMLDYCVVWALARCGSARSLSKLRELNRDASRSDAARRLAAAVILELIDADKRQSALDQVFAGLPPQLESLAREGPVPGFLDAVNQHLEGADQREFGILERMYLIDSPVTRPALLELLKSAPLRPPYFRRVRRIFKLAELRRDAEMFGLLAHRFETTLPSTTLNRWNREQVLGDSPKVAFSSNTRHYLRRRVWRTLRRLAELEDADYVRMAVGVLSPFSDGDALTPGSRARYDWYSRETDVKHWDRYNAYWALSHILHGNSRRYQATPAGRYFCCRPPFQPGGPEVDDREESFPRLWERQPEQVVDLIGRSHCEIVHRFAIKVLRACLDYCRAMPIDRLLVLLRGDYSTTVEYGFDLAKARYDATSPDFDLVLGLAGCNYEPARAQAWQWIEQQRPIFLADTDFLVQLVAGPAAESRQRARELLRGSTFDEQRAKILIVRLISLMCGFSDEEAARAADVCQTLVQIFSPQLRTIGSEVILDLLSHPLLELQVLAGDLVSMHQTLSSNPPEDVLRRLLGSEHAIVRAAGVRVINHLPSEVLVRSLEVLVALTRHEHADLREGIRPTTQRLAGGDPAFGRAFGEALLAALLVPGAPEQVPSHTSRVIREDLLGRLTDVPAEQIWQLLRSRSGPAQEVGGALLAQNVDSSQLKVAEIVDLGSHEILTVRQAARTFCEREIPRLRSEMDLAIKLLDARWEDTRTWAIAFIRDHLGDPQLLPVGMLVTICDSVRPEVQQFGRELIAKLFRGEDGPELAWKLSEHPSEAMQLFASNFLTEHVADQPDRLDQMMPYFVSVLSRVNRGRVAKQRVYAFLAEEGVKSRRAGERVGAVIGRLSANSAERDRSECLAVMTRLRDAWPELPLPITPVPVEVRDGV